MINVNYGHLQGDAHLLRFADGENELVDTGYPDESKAVVDRLKRDGVDVIHKIIISHPHRDHYGGLRRLLDSGVKIVEVRMNLPDRKQCDAETPWGCDSRDLARTVALLRDRGVPLKPLRPGDVLHRGQGVRWEVLYAYDGVHTPVGPTDINDMSVLCLLTAGTSRALFTGDLNARIGGYLAAQGKNLAADILKVPHHGTEGGAPNSFFDAVGAKVALVPSPLWLWQSDRSRRIREYFADRRIPTYVNGVDGDVRVVFREKGYTVLPDKREVR
jgi:competence protein ComEC